MLKKILFAAVFVVGLLGVHVQTAAADEFYGKVTVGQSFETEVEGYALSDDTTFGVAIGNDFGLLRAELGVTRISADTAGLSASAIDYSATVYVDYAVSDRGALFAGLGVDYVEAEAGLGPFSIEGDGPGWHYEAGYSHRITDALTLEASWRHLEADLDFGFGDRATSTNTAQLGLRFAL